jgi:hypothetical protein
MSEPTPAPDPESGRGPDDPDYHDPLTPDDILARAGPASPVGDGRSAGDSQASRLVAMALARYRLVRGEDGRLYATELDGPAIAYNLRGRDALRTRLARAYYDTSGQTPNGGALTDALCVLEGQAERTDPEPVALRVATVPGGRVVLDLGGADGRCVLIGPGGWQLAERSPVLVRRSALTSPLPDPQRGGSLDPLRDLINVDEAGFRLIVSWLVADLLPDMPHPILSLSGEQGTAKTTAARLVVCLIDPSPAPLRTPPTEMRSWAAAASASWVVALDNVSTIPAWFSDALCKAVTGDGIVERALHTDDDINVLTFRRCIALTTIDAGRLAGDLAERLLPVELARIPAGQRRPDAEIADAYTAARPGVLGALLDLTTQVLAAMPGVRLAELPRMADFARVLAALDAVCGWDTLATYTEATRDAARAVLDADPVAQAVCVLVERNAWHGTHDELLAALTPERPGRDWPKTPRGLSGRLKRLAPALRNEAGVIYEHGTRQQNRTITLRSERPGRPTTR